MHQPEQIIAAAKREFAHEQFRAAVEAECLTLIKKLQAPELAAIRERNRKRELRERMPTETFHAQIISIAA